jgi:hypothetical protein
MSSPRLSPLARPRPRFELSPLARPKARFDRALRMLAQLAAFLIAVLTGHAALAQEQAYVHIVRAGETLASIAQVYYGDARRGDVLGEENGLTDQPGLLEGMRLTIPAVRYHHVARGDTWKSIAERHYGDPNRALVLLKANEASAHAAPAEDAELLIPYPLRYVAHTHDTLATIAARYLRGRDDGRMLRAFNGGRAKISRGQLLLVPLFDLVLSPQGLARVNSAESGEPGAEQRSGVQAQVSRDIPLLDEYVRAGRFLEAASLGNQLLGRGELTGNQELSIQRQLATAYVALDREDLAVGAFARALSKQPDLELDSVRTSPRVLAALEAAKRQRKP